eukprot:Nk52_evm24s805 gene=Nk52_evmTU24s805
MGKVRTVRSRVHKKAVDTAAAKSHSLPVSEKRVKDCGEDDKMEEGEEEDLLRMIDAMEGNAGLVQKRKNAEAEEEEWQQQQQQKGAFGKVKETVGEGDEEKKMKKGDRRKLRHQKWIQKLEVQTQEKIKEKELHSKKAAYKSMGDFSSLSFALGSMADKGGKKKNKNGKGAQGGLMDGNGGKTVTSRKGRHFTACKEVDQFKNVIAHPLFAQNPLDVIKQHVMNYTKEQ